MSTRAPSNRDENRDVCSGPLPGPLGTRRRAPSQTRTTRSRACASPAPRCRQAGCTTRGCDHPPTSWIGPGDAGLLPVVLQARPGSRKSPRNGPLRRNQRAGLHSNPLTRDPLMPRSPAGPRWPGRRPSGTLPSPVAAAARGPATAPATAPARPIRTRRNPERRSTNGARASPPTGRDRRQDATYAARVSARSRESPAIERAASPTAHASQRRTAVDRGLPDPSPPVLDPSPVLGKSLVPATAGSRARADRCARSGRAGGLGE